MSEEGDQIMKLQRKMKVVTKATTKFGKTIPRKRHATKLDIVLAARGIK